MSLLAITVFKEHMTVLMCERMCERMCDDEMVPNVTFDGSHMTILRPHSHCYKQ